MFEQQVRAVVAETAKLDHDEFTAYSGGWKGYVGTALVDAVFSIRAKYQVKDPTKGVSGRLSTFNAKYPEAMNDLAELAAVGEPDLAEIMGHTKTGGRTKAACVIDAAKALLALYPPISTAEDFVAADPATVKAAYTSVHGLGWVTSEYFQMLLGAPGVKADRMIVRFVNAALEGEGMGAVDARTARELVVQAYTAEPRGETLTHYEHAIWRAKGELAVDAEEPDPEQKGSDAIQ